MTSKAGDESWRALRGEWPLLFSVTTTILYLCFGTGWLSDLSNLWWTGFLFVWLFGAILTSAFAVVRHADCLAIRLGEPYGTLILTLSVIITHRLVAQLQRAGGRADLGACHSA